MSPENPVPREGWGRRSGERDPVTGEPVTPVDAIERIETLEGRVRRDRIENRVLYGVVVGLLALVGVVYGQGQSEAATRIQQTCTIFETQQLDDVERLRGTYRYLSGLSEGERRESLNRAVLAQLPTVEREAGADDAPDYCDAHGVGLREPDPVVPCRPRSLPLDLNVSCPPRP